MKAYSTDETLLMGIRRLILLRHAKSDWNSGAATDFDRPLNHRGRQDAPRVGRWLQLHDLVPDVTCCSTACRTRQTLAGVMTGFHADIAAPYFLDELYHASEHQISSMVERFLPDHGTLLIVGHNPGLEMVLLGYCPDVRIPPDGKLMPTATVGVLDFSRSGSPVLERIVRPREL